MFMKLVGIDAKPIAVRYTPIEEQQPVESRLFEQLLMISKFPLIQ